MAVLKDGTSADHIKRRIDVLINTKLHVPPLKGRMLHRKHLIDRLSSGKDSRLFVVSGPAGSGKTSLICQWIHQENLRVAWYSLDEVDNDSDLFFRYLLTALGRLDSKLASEMAPWLHGHKRLSGPETIPYLIEHVSQIHKNMHLVLDDYHLITSQEIHKALSYFFEHMNPEMHVVISTRREIPFSHSRLKMRGQMMEISAEDLKFSYKETERFFTEVLRVKMSAGQVQELTKHMEGWVGGLQLFGLATKGKKIITSIGSILDKACEEAVDYLINEVIDIQPEKVKTFLQATALLDRFNAEVCREVTELPDATEMLDQVFRKNLFLNSLDSEGKWYRYHHLFSKALRKKSYMSSTDMYKRIYRKAALWFARNGYLEDAFRNAFASDDIEFAADMLEDYLMVLYERYAISSFIRWLSKLPREIFKQRTLLRLYECRFKVESVQLSDVTATVTDIECHRLETLARYEGAKRKRCEDLLVLFKHILHYWTDVPTINIKEVEEVLSEISPENEDLSAIIRTISRSSHMYRGDMRLASEALREASAAVFSCRSPLAKMIWGRTMAAAERFQGHLRQSEVVLKEAFPFLERSNLSAGPLEFMLYLPMAWISYMRNNLAKAAEYTTAVLKYVEQTRFVYEISDGNYLLALIHLARGEADKVEPCVLRMRWAMREVGRPSLLALTYAYCARLSIAQGDLGAAEQWAVGRGLSMDEPFSFHFVAECLAQAEVFYGQGRYDEVVRMLDTLHTRCMEHNMMEAVLEIDLLTAAALYKLKDLLQARTIMERALSFSETEGYVRPFVDQARIISPILLDVAKMGSRDRRSSYVTTIIKACSISKYSATMSSCPGRKRIGVLTPREKEILELMAVGLRDKEIAETAFVSLYTVKTHAKNIFQKLDVKTRVQAIQRAKDLKILQIKSRKYHEKSL